MHADTLRLDTLINEGRVAAPWLTVFSSQCLHSRETIDALYDLEPEDDIAGDLQEMQRRLHKAEADRMKLIRAVRTHLSEMDLKRDFSYPEYVTPLLRELEATVNEMDS